IQTDDGQSAAVYPGDIDRSDIDGSAGAVVARGAKEDVAGLARAGAGIKIERAAAGRGDGAAGRDVQPAAAGLTGYRQAPDGIRGAGADRAEAADEDGAAEGPVGCRSVDVPHIDRALDGVDQHPGACAVDTGRGAQDVTTQIDALQAA